RQPSSGYWQNVIKPDFPIVNPNPQPKREQSDWLSQTNPYKSTFLQTCGCRFGFPCHFRYDNPKAVQHNSGFQDDGIEASLKKYIRVVNPNSVNCYEQNCLSYFMFYAILKSQDVAIGFVICCPFRAIFPMH